MRNILGFASIAILFFAFIGAGLKALNENTSTDTLTLSELAGTNPSLSTFTATLKATGLDVTLDGADEYTLFAPSNEAFAKLPAGMLQDLLKPENKDKLKAILTRHMVRGKYNANQLYTTTLSSSSGDLLNVKVDNSGSITVDKAKVVKPDLKSKNGIIHVIDAVLIPGI